MNTISRTAFCHRCANAHRPEYWDLYLVCGGSSGDYLVNQCESNVSGRHIGFTPHIFRLERKRKDYVFITKTCGMHGCDVSIWKDDEGFGFRIEHQEKESMSIEDWNALVDFKDETYFI